MALTWAIMGGWLVEPRCFLHFVTCVVFLDHYLDVSDDSVDWIKASEKSTITLDLEEEFADKLGRVWNGWVRAARTSGQAT